MRRRTTHDCHAGVFREVSLLHVPTHAFILILTRPGQLSAGKGLINGELYPRGMGDALILADPDMNGTYQINRGLKLARKLLLDLTEMGIPLRASSWVSTDHTGARAARLRAQMSFRLSSLPT